MRANNPTLADSDAVAVRPARTRSLRGVLALHNIAFVILVGVTGALGVLATVVWQRATQDLLALNSLLLSAQQARGDVFREIRQIASASLLNDPTALDRYWQHLYQIDRRFYELEAQATEVDERAAIGTMRESYEVMQSEMNKLFAGGGGSTAAVRSVIDATFERRILGDFERAFAVLTARIEQRRVGIESRLGDWAARAPLLMAVPLLLALALLAFSSHLLQRQFVRPITEIERGAARLGQGTQAPPLVPEGVHEVASLARSLNRMAGELADSQRAVLKSERQAALGALVPVVAHNIRNPLASIRSTAQVLDFVAEPGERAELAASIIASVDRLERWVGALLNYLNPLRLERRAVAFAAVVDQAAEALAPRLTEKQLELERRGWSATSSAEAVTVEVDVDLLEQAIYGLLNNALEASPRGAKIVLSLTADGTEAVLEIRDQGAGMPFAPKPTDLSPGPSTKRFGTGLGIPFAFKVCEAHGGRLEFELIAAGGTCARLTLPFRGGGDGA